MKSYGTEATRGEGEAVSSEMVRPSERAAGKMSEQFVTDELHRESRHVNGRRDNA
jgi:hypothetical protein